MLRFVKRRTRRRPSPQAFITQLLLRMLILWYEYAMKHFLLTSALAGALIVVLTGGAKLAPEEPTISTVHTYQPGATQPFGTDTQYTVLSIFGAHLSGVFGVYIGDVKGENVRVINDGRVDVAVPPRGTTDPVDTPVPVSVYAAAGMASYYPGFTWVSTLKVDLGAVNFTLWGQQVTFPTFSCPTDHPWLAKSVNYPDGTLDIAGMGIWPASEDLETELNTNFMSGAYPYPLIGWFHRTVTNAGSTVTAKISALCTNRADNRILVVPPR